MPQVHYGRIGVSRGLLNGTPVPWHASQRPPLGSVALYPAAGCSTFVSVIFFFMWFFPTVDSSIHSIIPRPEA